MRARIFIVTCIQYTNKSIHGRLPVNESSPVPFPAQTVFEMKSHQSVLTWLYCWIFASLVRRIAFSSCAVATII